MTALAITACGCANESTKDEQTNYTATQVSAPRSTSRYIQIEEKAGTYVIKKGDQVELSVFTYPEFNTKAIIKDDGTMTIPLAGDVEAEGLTKDKLADRIKTKLGDFIKGDFKMTLTVTSPTLKKITVLGAVAHQDNFPAREEIGLAEVLALAGGATTESDLHKVRITRGGFDQQEALTIDVAAYMDAGNMNELPLVRPGDTVYVPKRENVVRDFSDFLRDAFFIFSFFRVVY